MQQRLRESSNRRNMNNMKKAMENRLLRKTTKEEKKLLGIQEQEEKEGKLVSALMKMNKTRKLHREGTSVEVEMGQMTSRPLIEANNELNT